MTIYALYHHNQAQVCPDCQEKVWQTYVYANSEQEAATSTRAFCRECYSIGLGARPIIHLFHPWYGFDLDGTLAKYPEPFDIMKIGEPIMPMVWRVRQYLEEGKAVKIFTARVAGTGGYSASSQKFDDQEFVKYQTELIEDWCTAQFGRPLPVTAIKDMACVEFYDDRAKQVIPGTGKLVEEWITVGPQKPLYVIRGVDKLSPFDEDDLIEGG